MDLLKALSRKTAQYEVDFGGESVVFHLNELSAQQQLNWAESTKDRDMVDVYAELLITCCDELSGHSVDDVKNISTSHLMAMGNKIVELSEAKKI